MKGLIIDEPWIDYILSGRKKWEIRGSNTKVRGSIALIRKGSGLVVGKCELADVKGPLTLAEMQRELDKHRIPKNVLELVFERYSSPYAWILKNAKPLRKPVRYHHPRGAVIWVNLRNLGAKI
jgi:hypothetical protein